MSAAAVAPWGPIAVVIPMRLTNPLNNSQGISRGGMFARAKEKRAKRGTTRLVLSPFSRSLLAAIAEGPLEVTITRIAPRSLDIDGLWASAKQVIDGTADACGTKDNDPRLSWDVQQRRGKPREYAVEIVIERRT